MLYASTASLAVLALGLGPSSVSARMDRLPGTHNSVKRSAPDHHLMAAHLISKRDAVDDAISAIASALESSVDVTDSLGDVLPLAAAAQAPSPADLGSAVILAADTTGTTVSAKADAAAAKKAAAKSASIASASSVSSAKSVSSVARASSSVARASSKDASLSSKSASLSASRSSHSAAVLSASKSKSSSVSASRAASSKKHASAVASASKSKASAKAAKTTTTSAKVAKTSAGTVLAAVSVNVKGLIGFSASNCGSSGANADTPNGAEEWLNCGLSVSDPTSGWTPPAGVTIDKLAYVSLETAMAENSVWAPCAPYISLFEKWGEATGLPPILLASFAMQESTCNVNESGDSGGAFGLMQITKDKCAGRDTAGCNEPDFNIMTGAQYFASQLSAYSGNVLLALGQYNGWYSGLTYDGATAAASTGCCECQQNLDYMHQMLNGWLQGRTGYELGSIGNLDVCGV